MTEKQLVTDRETSRYGQVGSVTATALPGLIWAAAVMLVVLSSTNVIALAAVAAACLVAAPVSARGRRPLFGAAFALGLFSVTIWLAWSLLIHRDGSTGTVLWVLPAWNPPNGGSFGGAVTLTQLHYGLVRALRAIAFWLVLGLLAQRTDAARWLILAEAVLGRGARLFAALLCMPDAYLEQRAGHRRALVAGFRAGSASGRLAGVPLASRLWAESWLAATSRTRSRVHGVVGLAGQVLLLAAWAFALMAPGPLAGLSSIELTALWLAAAIVFGLACHHRDLGSLRLGAADLPALLGGAAVAAAWITASATGEATVLVTEVTQIPVAPVIMLAALAVLPLGCWLVGDRT